MVDPVYEEKATYYDPSTRTWVPGDFTLNNRSLSFRGDNTRLELPLANISGIEKRQSSFVFAALVICVVAEKHWFSSFLRRDGVYNLLELFWRESLLSHPHRTVTQQKKTASSGLGKELLGILHDSENTLVGAANQLSRQGRQIEESQSVLSDVNSDLDVAEKLLRTMNVTSAILQSPELTKLNQENPPAKQFQILYGVNNTAVNSREKGTLVIKSNEIIIKDEYSNIRMSATSNELSALKVKSQWDLNFSKNNADICHMTCAQMPKVLQFLDSQPSLKRKMVVEPYEYSIQNESSSSYATARTSLYDKEIASDPGSQEKQTQPPNSLGALVQDTLEEEDTISEEDLEMISRAIGGLQALSIEVAREQQNQLDKIEDLIGTVEKTEIRMRSDNKEIKKKM